MKISCSGERACVCVEEEGEGVQDDEDRVRPSFYRHKEGRNICTGGEEVAVPPRIGGAQRTTTVESTLWDSEDHGAGRAVVLGGVLALRRSRWRPCGSSGCRGISCRGYRPLCAMWQCLEGPAGGSLTPVKARAAFEGCAHAVRGFPGGESTREVRGVGGTVVITVLSTSGLGVAGSHSVVTVSGMAEQ